MALLELKNISFGFGNDIILDNVNLKIEEGSFVGLVGLNGSGKTTLLRIMLSLLKPTKGQVITSKKIKFGYVNQTTSTEEGDFPQTVFECVSLGLKKKPFHFLTKDDKSKVTKMLDLFNITDLKDRPIGSLSGGQGQKVKIAKVFLSNPDVIILDEPTTGIDKASEYYLGEMINHLHAMKKTIILVSHDKKDLEKCDIIYKIVDKKVEEFSEDDLYV